MPSTYRITNFITHIADPVTGQLTLSDLETPIGAGSLFPHDFFQDYLELPMKKAQRRFATFRHRKEGVMGPAMSRLLAHPDEFVAVSRDIATHMNTVLQKRSSGGAIRISPGDLMVARFLVEDGAGSPPHLAVLKIHPTQAVLRHPESYHGRRLVKVFESDEGVPAPAEEALQKIALVAPALVAKPQRHDVVILDQQIREKDVATFFFDEFLETDLERDPETDADFVLDVIKGKLSQALRMVKPPLSARERLQVVARAEQVLMEKPVIVLAELVDKTVEALAGRPAEDQQKIKDELLDRFGKVSKVAKRLRPDQTVSVSLQKVTALSSTRTLTFDYGVTLSGPSDRLDDMMTIAHDANGRTVVTITSDHFQIG